MDIKDRVVANRRGFIRTLSGLLSALLLANPTRLLARKTEIKDLISNLELELLERSRPIRNPSITWHTHGDRTSLYIEIEGRAQPMCAMNQVGTTIWEACNGENTPRDISNVVDRKYQVSSRQAYVDCLTFLVYLKKAKVIYF
jgi:hypothetical protein